MDRFGKYLLDNFQIPDGVHDIRAHIFFKNILRAEEKVMNLLEKGILINEKYLPLKYAKANNRSARVRTSFLFRKNSGVYQKRVHFRGGGKTKIY